MVPVILVERVSFKRLKTKGAHTNCVAVIMFNLEEMYGNMQNPLKSLLFVIFSCKNDVQYTTFQVKRCLF